MSFQESLDPNLCNWQPRVEIYDNQIFDIQYFNIWTILKKPTTVRLMCVLPPGLLSLKALATASKKPRTC